MTKRKIREEDKEEMAQLEKDASHFAQVANLLKSPDWSAVEAEIREQIEYKKSKVFSDKKENKDPYIYGVKALEELLNHLSKMADRLSEKQEQLKELQTSVTQ